MSHKYIVVTQAPPTPPAAPTAPNTLVATADLVLPEIELTWVGPSTTETGFKLERSLDAGVTWTRYRQFGANVLAFTDENLAWDTTYHYRIRAFRATVHSTYSNTANATTVEEPAP